MKRNYAIQAERRKKGPARTQNERQKSLLSKEKKIARNKRKEYVKARKTAATTQRVQTVHPATPANLPVQRRAKKPKGNDENGFCSSRGSCLH